MMNINITEGKLLELRKKMNFEIRRPELEWATTPLQFWVCDRWNSLVLSERVSSPVKRDDTGLAWGWNETELRPGLGDCSFPLLEGLADRVW